MTRENVLSSLLALALASIVLFIIFHIQSLLWLSVFFLIIGLYENPLARFIVKNWLWFSRKIGEINSTFILCFIFFAFLTPFSFLYRFFNREVVDRFFKRKENTYFVPMKEYSKNSFLKPW